MESFVEITRSIMDVPGGQVSGIISNITKVNYLMHIADLLKVNIKIEAI